MSEVYPIYSDAELALAITASSALSGTSTLTNYGVAGSFNSGLESMPKDEIVFEEQNFPTVEFAGFMNTQGKPSTSVSQRLEVCSVTEGRFFKRTRQKESYVDVVSHHQKPAHMITDPETGDIVNATAFKYLFNTVYNYSRSRYGTADYVNINGYLPEQTAIDLHDLILNKPSIVRSVAMGVMTKLYERAPTDVRSHFKFIDYEQQQVADHMLFVGYLQYGSRIGVFRDPAQGAMVSAPLISPPNLTLES